MFVYKCCWFYIYMLLHATLLHIYVPVNMITTVILSKFYPISLEQ